MHYLRYGNARFVDERHRHRYEVNPEMVPEFEKAGLSFVGKDESGRRMEVELENSCFNLHKKSMQKHFVLLNI
jgi:CTP synthase (UTP-ammonia lyase)